MQIRQQIDFPSQPPEGQPRPLASSSLDDELQPETPAFNDGELFIRRAFDESPRKGCELLFRRYHQALCSHAVRFVYLKETAEDLVSDVFCKFWKTKAYATITSSYRYYLFRSVRNEAYNYLRLEFQKLDGIETAEIREGALSQRPDQVLQFEEVVHKVEDLVESLPPQCRKVFFMSRFEGKKYQDIATELGLSVKTVEVHIVKALSIVRKGMKDYWLMLVSVIGHSLFL
ncbi:RNA polymerase sigma-70 factor [Larkinella rosea]|uniref:RNA polymerase sigma-70 factor n=1 Tax=Larkinella rosea TaxID=2025312 RepID=A0A3P1BRX5_9BACT|nr:RNA polymerase sigma-70 factor [Larkinella rosea]RRB03831.1 RNA polymerase sigma-70 factor [Larkinella rosea]